MNAVVLTMCIQAFNVCEDLSYKDRYMCAMEASQYCNYAAIANNIQLTNNLIKSGNYNEKDRNSGRQE